MPQVQHGAVASPATKGHRPLAGSVAQMHQVGVQAVQPLVALASAGAVRLRGRRTRWRRRALASAAATPLATPQR
eukprot:180824-Chlamydomonas_euryale.AAC.5